MCTNFFLPSDPPPPPPPPAWVDWRAVGGGHKRLAGPTVTPNRTDAHAHGTSRPHKLTDAQTGPAQH